MVCIKKTHLHKHYMIFYSKPTQNLGSWSIHHYLPNQDKRQHILHHPHNYLWPKYFCYLFFTWFPSFKAKFFQLSNFFHEPIYFPGFPGTFWELLGELVIVQIRKPPGRPQKKPTGSPRKQGKEIGSSKRLLNLKRMALLCFTCQINLL